RAVELLLAAFERLGLGVAPEWLREVLLNEGGFIEESGEAGVAPRSQTRKRGVIARQQTEEKMVRIRLEGARLTFGDIRIVDSKYACYRITIVPCTGPRWEVWRRMADIIKLKAALTKVPMADVDLPPLPHSYRRSFDASHLTRRRRRIQRFLQVALAHPPLRDCDALLYFFSPE
ncbi:unnamed protein product, partial [Laminaria digitata]